MPDELPIAERVRFWQEQDRINKALIPRIFKLHERLTELEKRESSDIATLLGALESRITNGQKAEIAALRAELDSLAINVDRRFRIFGRSLIAIASLCLLAALLALFRV